MTVIAQAIADREAEIERLQAEIKALTDVEQLFGAAAAPSARSRRSSRSTTVATATAESKSDAKPPRKRRPMATEIARNELAMLEELFGDKPRNPAQIRVLIRSGFSAIEALISMMMVSARSGMIRMAPNQLSTHKDTHRYFFEICALHDMAYRMDNSGEIHLSRNKTTLKGKAIFVIKCLARSCGRRLKPQSVDGWSAFDKAVKIRNRITHPSDGDSLSVTEEEFDTVLEAFRWVVRCNHRALGGKDL